MHQLSQGVLEHFRAYVADMDASRRDISETNARTVELLEAMNKTSGQQAMYLARLQEYQAALTATSQQYVAWTDRFLSNAQEQTRMMQREMDRAVEQMHEGAQALVGSYDQFTRMTRENMAAQQESTARTTALFDESINASIRQLNETLAAMRETTQLMPQLLSQSRERYAEQVDQFVTALVRLHKSMEQISDAIKASDEGKE